VALTISCERAIEFKPADPEPKLVVEGTIENDEYPRVVLSRSLNFFSDISYSELSNSFVRNATVSISNGEKTHTLKEYEVEVGADLTLSYYSIDSSHMSTAFKGELNKTYSLEIAVDGKKYSSTTTIPALAKTISKLYYDEWVDEKDSSKVILYGEFTDPVGYGNYIRYFTKVGSQPFYPGLNSVFDDQIVDGKTYNLQIEQGVNRNSDIDFEEYSFFHRGDEVTVKFCNIDRGVFDFWRTMEYGYQSIGNPFSSPTKVKGNISNGALGYFGGYAVQYVTIDIPE
jgi:hypothetical protein